MGIKRYTAINDNTITNAFQPNLITRGTSSNMGLADSLEVFSIYAQESSSSYEESKLLIKFPVVTADATTTIQSDRTAGTIPASGSVDFYLRLYNVKHTSTLPRNFTLVISPVSQSWQEGDGLDMDEYSDVTYNGTGSNWINAQAATEWTNNSGRSLTSSTDGGSYLSASWNGSPVTTYDEFNYTQTFGEDGTGDLEVKITGLVEQWIIGTSGDGYDNYGVGVMLTASQEASSSVDALAGLPTGRADDDGLIQNPSGSTTSYYIKRFFGRKSQYFFKRPHIEARWDDSLRDDRGDFHYSSSLADGPDNLNTIYLYNYVRGILKDIPGIEKTGSIMVSLFSGNLDDTRPTGSSGQLHINSSSNPGNEGKVGGVKLHVTGGWVSTGIYSASLAITASKTTSGFDPILTLYDVWSTGSIVDADHLQTQFHTGTIKPIILESDNRMQKHRNYLSITNLRNSYRADETARFNLFVREKNWSPNIYTKASSNIETKTVHSASYRVYRTLDANDSVTYGTGSDKHTYLSYDVSGNYFDFDMSLLEPGYEYSFKFSFYDNSLSTWVEQEQAFKFRVEDYEY